MNPMLDPDGILMVRRFRRAKSAHQSFRLAPAPSRGTVGGSGRSAALDARVLALAGTPHLESRLTWKIREGSVSGRDTRASVC